MEVKYYCQYNDGEENKEISLGSCHQFLFESSLNDKLLDFIFDCEIIIEEDEIKTNYKNYPRQSSRTAIEDLIPDFETLQLLFEKCEEIVGWKCFEYEITNTSLKVKFIGNTDEVEGTIKLKVLWYMIRNIITSFQNDKLLRLYVNTFIYNSLVLKEKDRFKQLFIPFIFIITIYNYFNHSSFYFTSFNKNIFNHTPLISITEYNHEMYNHSYHVKNYGQYFYTLYHKFKFYTDEEFEKKLNSCEYIYDADDNSIIECNKLTKDSKYFINMKTEEENNTFLKNICNLRRFKKWYLKECNGL
jgi:hypothetical protein